MKSKYLLTILLAVLFIVAEYITAQSTTEYSDYRRSLKKNNTNAVESPGGLLSENSSCLIGREPGPIKYRAVYQFDIPENIIPDGSQITKAIFSVDCTKNNHTTELYAYFYNITYDMVSTDNYDEIFAQMEVVNSDIGQAISYNNQLILNSNDPVNPYPEFKQAIQNSLVNNKFVLGIMWGNDGLTQSKTWYLNNFTMSLYIEFTVPNKNVVVDQKLSNNSSVDSVGLWNLTLSKFDKDSVPKTFTWNVNDTKTLQGSQKVLSSQKYNYWDGYTDVVNHKTFSIQQTTSELKSQFNPTNSIITIKNNLESTGIDGGSVQFKDPWLIDYPDVSYGGTLRNQGMSAPFREQTSPFSPDLSSSYNGYVYKGIFLNQSGPQNDWDGSYYSVGSPTEQTIPVNNQSRKFYPFNWTGTGVTIQNEYYPETGIVFNSSNAVATATLKGQLMSNSTTGISSNSQRKMVRTDNGIYHVIYESMGNVFYTHSLTSNFDGEWAEDMWVYDHAKNPAIEYDGNIVKAVLEYYDPAYHKLRYALCTLR